ncbi:MAG: gephyrin-like molybdotransferase Glp [Anaerolineales bacterium]
MLSVLEARQRLLASLPVCGVERVPLAQADSRVLAADVRAPADSPRFNNSSMDGFAVRAADVTRASKEKPVRLPVVGDVPAGAVLGGSLGAGQAVRIMTGAGLPAGADAIVPVEDTDAAVAQAGAALPREVSIYRPVSAGDYVRPAGEDFRAGDDLMHPGLRLRPQDLGLLAMLGIADVSVFRKPRVAILSSGNELVPVGGDLAPGKIYETNSVALGALVASCGAEAMNVGIARDELQAVQSHLESAAEIGADLIITSAGVSVGAYDYLREAVLSRGELDFWKVNMRPGKPFAFGRYREIPTIGLPGNPVSAFVGFEVFVRPALQKMAGAQNWQRRCMMARLLEDVNSDGRESYLRVQIQELDEGPGILLTGHQGSGNLYSLVRAEGLMVVPAGVKELSAGSLAEVWPF